MRTARVPVEPRVLGFGEHVAHVPVRRRVSRRRHHRGAERTHPWITGHPRRSRREAFEGVDAAGAPFETPLPEALPSAPAMSFDAEILSSVRPWLAGHARALGVSCDRVDDLVLAVSEISVNSVRHGGGRGVVRIWPGDDAVVCEVADAGSTRIRWPGASGP